MIRIAVCDDEPCFTEQIDHIIANHARDISLSPETVLYTSSGQLLYDVEEGAHFDLLLLDIEMPEKDGMSLAASLRRHLPMSLIIFISSHTQYAVKAYELSVFRYIPKSEMETCLPLALKDACRILKQSASDTYIIESARRIQKISVEDIIYVYKQQKYSVMAAKGGEIPVRKSLAQVLEELNAITAGSTGSFLMVERGYIVNMFHVEKLEDEQIYLDNGSVLPVSRNRLKETREAITRYWRKML